jgi:peptide alpha-N-acetyltransferase
MGSIITDLVAHYETDRSEVPTMYMWLLNLAAHHQCRIGEYAAALELIDKAIAHTPTVPDLYLTKGKVLTKSGEIAQASEVFDEARKLDLADRYLNNKSAKYKLRNNDIPGAHELMAMFSREVGEDLNVHDM